MTSQEEQKQNITEQAKENKKDEYKLSFEEVKKIVGFDFDHAFLTFKKELLDYGYEFKRLSLKERWVWIVRKQK